uniref:Uncharacterized protein n=1 Tax=Arundo donax TaxID=35708 RepID=A0A0A9E5F5_ARUDO
MEKRQKQRLQEVRESQRKVYYFAYTRLLCCVTDTGAGVGV